MSFKRHENGTLNGERFYRVPKLLKQLAPQAGLEPASAEASARQASNPPVNSGGGLIADGVVLCEFVP